MRWLSRLLLIGCLLSMPACGINCETFDGGGPSGPRLNNLQATMASRFGGAATIRVTVTDSQAIESVRATITPLAARQAPIQVTLSAPPGSDIYQGSATIPTNQRSDGVAQRYRVSATAINAGGRQASISIELEVPAPPQPPPEPDFGG